MIELLIILIILIAYMYIYHIYSEGGQDNNHDEMISKDMHRENSEEEKDGEVKVQEDFGIVGGYGYGYGYGYPVAPVVPVVPVGPIDGFGGYLAGFSAFGGMPVPGGWREMGHAWPGWNVSSPWGPHSYYPEVWY
jgi:hypothetical protein